MYERVRWRPSRLTCCCEGNRYWQGCLRGDHVNSARQSGRSSPSTATLPAQLVESELFGHERGAFTGADRRVPGKVELAHGGTLFLDELGELPLEAQAKLLRFLQDRVFERVGGRTTTDADVRAVCVTNKDLEREMRRGTFRETSTPVLWSRSPSTAARSRRASRVLARHFADSYAPYTLRAAVRRGWPARAHRWPGTARLDTGSKRHRACSGRSDSPICSRRPAGRLKRELRLETR